jgi:C-terminal processing protease CtpA/Prc
VDRDAAAFKHTLKRLVAALQDGHGGVAYGTGTPEAAPAVDLMFLDGVPIVQRVGEGAEGLPLGSAILSVDGEPVADLLARLRPEVSAAAPGHREVKLAGEMLRGPAGRPAVIRYRDPREKEGEASVPRNGKAAFRRQAPLAELRPGIWYVDMSRQTGQGFKQALPALARAKALVFDLREYPRLGSGFMQHCSPKPLEGGLYRAPVISRPDGAGWAWDASGTMALPPLDPVFTGKLAFLVGGGTVSAGETFAEQAEAGHLGLIVGEPTAGTNGEANPFTLPGGYVIHWTGMQALKHDGSRNHGVGVHPTVTVKPTLRGLAEGRDEVLERALSELVGLGAPGEGQR